MLDKYKHSGALQALKFNSLLIRKKKNKIKKKTPINIGLIPYAIKQASYLFITQLYISTI